MATCQHPTCGQSFHNDLKRGAGTSSFTAGPMLIHTDSGEGADIVFSYAHTKGPNLWQVASSEAQHLGI